MERGVELVDADAEVAEHEEGGAQEHAPVPATARTPNLERQRKIERDKDTEVAEHKEGGAQEHAPVPATARTPNLYR